MGDKVIDILIPRTARMKIVSFPKGKEAIDREFVLREFTEEDCLRFLTLQFDQGKMIAERMQEGESSSLSSDVLEKAMKEAKNWTLANTELFAFILGLEQEDGTISEEDRIYLKGVRPSQKQKLLELIEELNPPLAEIKKKMEALADTIGELQNIQGRQSTSLPADTI